MIGLLSLTTDSRPLNHSGRLPEDYRQVIRLRFIKGWRVREVAEHLGRSEPAVHMLCHRALKRLHAQMGASSKYLTR